MHRVYSINLFLVTKIVEITNLLGQDWPTIDRQLIHFLLRKTTQISDFPIIFRKN